MIPASSELFQVTRMVVAALDAAGVRYFLRGSVASALYGEARSTRDVDLVAALLSHHVEPFLAALGDGFYADATAIRDAVAARRSFNVIHLDTMVKVDIFVFKADPFGRSQFARRTPGNSAGMTLPRSTSPQPRIPCWPSSNGIARAAVCRTANGTTCSGSSKSRARRLTAPT